MPKLLSTKKQIFSALIFCLWAGCCAYGQTTTTTTPSAQTGSSQPATPPKQIPVTQPAKPKTTPAKTKTTSAKGKPATKEPSAEPDKVLYERAMLDMKKGRYTEGRLALQTLINTYPDSEYLAKAKLGVADSYYKEGGTSNITQAVQEYKDFITFFPFLDEAAYAQMQVAMAHYKMMEKPDRDRTQAENAEDEFQTFLLKYPQSPLVPSAEQKLRDVQEILADSQFRVGRFYYLKQDYQASGARLMDLSQRYPLYSQSDEALWMLGDIYSRAKQFAKNEDAKNHWADLAAECYDRLVRDYPLSKLAPDAKARLAALGMKVPAADPQAAEEMKKEQMYQKQHAQHSFVKLPMSFVKSMPDVSTAAHHGQPNLNPPDDAISATDVLKPGAAGPSFDLAMRPAGNPRVNADNQPEVGAPSEAVPVANDSSSASGNNLGVQIIDNGNGGNAATTQGAAESSSAQGSAKDSSSSAPTITLQPVNGSPAAADANPAAGAGENVAAPATSVSGSDANGSDATAGANSSAGGTIAQPAAQPADKADSKTESTSKKKKGLHKVVPF